MESFEGNRKCEPAEFLCFVPELQKSHQLKKAAQPVLEKLSGDFLQDVRIIKTGEFAEIYVLSAHVFRTRQNRIHSNLDSVFKKRCKKCSVFQDESFIYSHERGI